MEERAGNPSLQDSPDLDKIYKEQIEKAVEKFEGWEMYSVQEQKVEHRSMPGFIPHTDGGYEVIGFYDEFHYFATGDMPHNEKAKEGIQKSIDMSLEYAMDDFKEKYAKEIEGIPQEKLNYHDLYEMGKGDLAEKLSELESENLSGDNSTVAYRVGIYYYSPESEGDSHSGYVYSEIDWEAPYHRSGKISGTSSVPFKQDFEFKDAKELESILPGLIDKALESLE